MLLNLRLGCRQTRQGVNATKKDYDDTDKTEDELDTYPEKWIYLLKFSESFDEIPDLFRSDGSFDTFFEASERAGFTKEEEQVENL